MFTIFNIYIDMGRNLDIRCILWESMLEFSKQLMSVLFIMSLYDLCCAVPPCILVCDCILNDCISVHYPFGSCMFIRCHFMYLFFALWEEVQQMGLHLGFTSPRSNSCSEPVKVQIKVRCRFSQHPMWLSVHVFISLTTRGHAKL